MIKIMFMMMKKWIENNLLKEIKKKESLEN